MMEVMKNTNLTDEQRFKQWTNILNGLVGDAVEQQQIANSLYEAYQQAAEQQGFEIFRLTALNSNKHLVKALQPCHRIRPTS